jgi:hypothetical protein
MKRKIANSMRRNNIIVTSLFLLLIFFSMSSYGQVKFGLGASATYNHNNHFLVGMPYTNNSYYPDFSTGIQGIMLIGEKVRIRLGVDYSNLNFERVYNFVNNDNPARLDRSQLWVSSLSLIPKVDYKILKAGKFDMYVSGGGTFEFLLGDFEKTVLANNAVSSSRYIKNDFTKTLMGVNGSLLFKYNFSENIGMTLSPGYTYFFDKYYSKNIDNLQRIGVSIGCEWKF